MAAGGSDIAKAERRSRTFDELNVMELNNSNLTKGQTEIQDLKRHVIDVEANFDNEDEKALPFAGSLMHLEDTNKKRAHFSEDKFAKHNAEGTESESEKSDVADDSYPITPGDIHMVNDAISRSERRRLLQKTENLQERTDGLVTRLDNLDMNLKHVNKCMTENWNEMDERVGRVHQDVVTFHKEFNERIITDQKTTHSEFGRVNDTLAKLRINQANLSKTVTDNQTDLVNKMDAMENASKRQIKDITAQLQETANLIQQNIRQNQMINMQGGGAPGGGGAPRREQPGFGLNRQAQGFRNVPNMNQRQAHLLGNENEELFEQDVHFMNGSDNESENDDDNEEYMNNRNEHRDRRRERDDERDFVKSLPKLEKYSGKSRWNTFINQFEKLANLNGWRGGRKMDALHLALGEKALDYYENLGENIKGNYRATVKAMASRFGPDLPVEAQRSAFYNLEKEGKESLRAFADRVKDTAMEAFPGIRNNPNYSESFMVQVFLKGLNSPDAAMHNLNQNHRTLDEALRGVQKFEEHQKVVYGARPKTRSVKPNQNNQDQTPNSESDSELDSHLEEASINALTANYRSRQGRPGRPGRGSPSPSGKQTQPEGVRFLDQHLAEQTRICQRALEQVQSLIQSIPNQLSSAVGDAVMKSLEHHRSASPGKNAAQQGRSPNRGNRNGSPRGSPNRKQEGCFVCGSYNHYQRDCPVAMRPQESVCRLCKQPGHFQRDCPEAVRRSLNNNGAV